MKKNLLTILLFSFVFANGQTRLWNIKSLEYARKSGSEVSKVIVREADKYLNRTIPTIMDKPMTPPSGDKHDYWSMGRYWWPNPKTADGLPYIRKDGVVNPEIDKLDRIPMSTMSRSVTYLSLAYYLTSDEKYAAKAVENLRVWFVNKSTRMNPNMNYGQTIPGRNDGNGRGEGVLDTYSFVEMLDGVELLKESKSLTKKDKQALQDWFTAYLNWLQTSEIAQEEFNAKNNHGTAYDIQVTRYAFFTGNENLAKKFIGEFPVRRLFAQIEPNGSQPLELARTTAYGYSVYNLTHFLDMCSLAKTINIDLFKSTSSDGRCISKAIGFLIPYIDAKLSDFPYQQIKDWEVVQTKLRWQLYRADKLNGTSDYQNHYNAVLNIINKDNLTVLY